MYKRFLKAFINSRALLRSLVLKLLPIQRSIKSLVHLAEAPVQGPAILDEDIEWGRALDGLELEFDLVLEGVRPSVP